MQDLKPVREVAHFNKIILNLPPATEVHVLCMVAQVEGTEQCIFTLSLMLCYLMYLFEHLLAAIAQKRIHIQKACVKKTLMICFSLITGAIIKTIGYPGEEWWAGQLGRPLAVRKGISGSFEVDKTGKSTHLNLNQHLCKSKIYNVGAVSEYSNNCSVLCI